MAISARFPSTAAESPAPKSRPLPLRTLDPHYVRWPGRFCVLLIGAYLIAGLLFAIQTPAWQAPDEPAHYN